MASNRAVADAGVLAGERGPGARAVAVVEFQSTSAVGLGGGELSATHRCDSGEEQRLHEHAGVVRPLGERHGFGSQGGAEPQFGTDETPDHNPPHDREQLGRLSDPLAQVARPLEDRADLRGGVTVRRDVRRAERIEQLELQSVTIGRRRERADERQAFRQVADGLDLRRPFSRPQPRLQPVPGALLGQARLGEVMGEQLRPRLGGLRELRFQHFGDPPMELLALPLDQRVVQRVFEECVFEDVRAARRPALRVQDLRLNQLGQLRLQRRFVQRRDRVEQLVAELAAEHGGELGHVALSVHAVEPGHHQVLKGGGNLVAEQRLAARAAFPFLVWNAGLLHHRGELFDEQRHAAGPVVDLLDQGLRQRTLRLRPHQVAHLALREPIQRQRWSDGRRRATAS